MNFRHLPWAIAFVCMVLGFMLSQQFKVQKQVALKDATVYNRAQDLAAQLAKAEEERDDLMAELEDLRGKMRAMAGSQAEFRDLAQQLERAQVYAGLLPVTGSGVTVIMNDSARPVQPGENPNNFIIHDEDVLRVLNELAAAGAEAISINGQRLTSRSEIRCTGPTITINGVRTAPPIMISVVGNPDALEQALNMRHGVADSLREWGISVTVKKEPTVNVPAYKGSLKFQYGTPVLGEVPSP